MREETATASPLSRAGSDRVANLCTACIPCTVPAAAATGRSTCTRTRTDTDRYGLTRLRLPRVETLFGYQAGDLARVVVPAGKNAGPHTERIAVRATGRCNIRTRHGLIQGFGHQSVSSDVPTATPAAQNPKA